GIAKPTPATSARWPGVDVGRLRADLWRPQLLWTPLVDGGSALPPVSSARVRLGAGRGISAWACAVRCAAAIHTSVCDGPGLPTSGSPPTDDADESPSLPLSRPGADPEGPGSPGGSLP